MRQGQAKHRQRSRRLGTSEPRIARGLEGDGAVQRYWIDARRSLIAMGGAARKTGSVGLRMVGPLMRPFVVMAARVLGPGPMRLKMVKLAHNLSNGGVVVAPVGGFGGEELGPVAQPTSRAA
jgi:hypothetical protein